MRVEVLENFYDLQLKTLHHKGDQIDVTEERAVQIKTVLPGHIKPVEETNQPEPNLSEMTKKKLITHAESLGIEVEARMNKSQIIELITEALEV